MCAMVGSGQVVFDNSSNATSFTDNSSDPCGAPTNDTTWFYKVFLRDQKNYYATQPIANGSVYTAEISANAERYLRRPAEFKMDCCNIFDHSRGTFTVSGLNRNGGIADESLLWH